MHGSDVDSDVLRGLALYFGCFGLMNLVYTLRQFQAKNNKWAAAWMVFTVYLMGSAWDFFQVATIADSAQRGAAMQRLTLVEGFRDFVDRIMNPVSYFVISCAAFAAMLYYRRFFVKTETAWVGLNLALLFTGLSMTDTDFRAIVAKPDNVPISMLIFLVGLTTWVAMRQAVENDDRIAQGKKPLEAEGADKVLTWPDLVYTEMLAMIILTVGLLVWSICLKAPLEPPSSQTEIPNPSKAPWYFLGLQEMLVYFDPWLAGVVLPTYIIIGLCAIPYVDTNRKGNGYYTFNERPFAITIFLIGFVLLWVVLIVLGTFLRGPNWNFFGPYEYWSPYKTVALNNVNLSDFFWIDVMGTALPQFWLVRELPGIILIVGYFGIAPIILATTWMRSLYPQMGLARFMITANILLMMGIMPIKMVLRWVFNLKYLVYIPEYFFNI